MKPQAKSLIDYSRLAESFLGVVVEVFSNKSLGPYLYTLNRAHHFLHGGHLKVEWSRVTHLKTLKTFH